MRVCRRLAIFAICLAASVLAAPTNASAQVTVPQAVAPVIEGDGHGLCIASSVSNNPQADFGFLNITNYLGNMNTFMESRISSRVESVIRTVSDLSNNNAGGLQSSFGDFIDAMRSECQTGGCGFFVNDSSTSFGSRIRGYFNVTPELANVPIHFGLYTDDAISLTFFDKNNGIYPVIVLAPQLGAPTWRLTETVIFSEAGLYPLEILYVEIVEHAAIELSFFIGPFTDFQRPSNQSPIIQLDDVGFALFQPTAFFQTISGAPSFPDLNECQQCDRQFVNLPGNNGCDGGFYCNEAALCAPCDTAIFCGESCSPCGGNTPFCINVNQENTCAQCRDDTDCPEGFSCDPDDHTCSECNVDADCGRGEICVDNSCEVCSNDDACAGNSCNCCAVGPSGVQMTCTPLEQGGPPVCVECVTNADCATGVCDVFVGHCVEQLFPNERSDCCGDNCVACPDEFPYCLPGPFGTSCQECRNDLDCLSGDFCLSGQCQPCTRDKHCGVRCESCEGDAPFCFDGQTPDRSFCVGCVSDDQCGDGTCNLITNQCEPLCDMSCGAATPYCLANACVECFADTQCPCGGTCDLASNSCTVECKGNTDCLGNEHCRWNVRGDAKECALGPMPDDVACGGTLATACSASVGRPGGGHSTGTLALMAVLLLSWLGQRRRRGARRRGAQSRSA